MQLKRSVKLSNVFTVLVLEWVTRLGRLAGKDELSSECLAPVDLWELNWTLLRVQVSVTEEEGGIEDIAPLEAGICKYQLILSWSGQKTVRNEPQYFFREANHPFKYGPGAKAVRPWNETIYLSISLIGQKSEGFWEFSKVCWAKFWCSPVNYQSDR